MSDLPHPIPFHFGPAARPLFGWQHAPAPGAPLRDTAVVICAPFGYEAQCVHRSLRSLARTAASVGFPALRFDLDGTGDSAGTDFDADRWAHWLGSVRDAIAAVRSVSGVSRVVLVGIRLGAALAAEAAEGRDDVAGLVVIAPVVAGKAWLREQRALQIALDLAPAPEGTPAPEGVQESVGFALTAGTRESIQGVDLTAASRVPAKVVLILDREDRAPSEAWAARLRGLGATVERLTLPGYVDMVLDPHNAQPPTAMIDVFRGWLDREMPDASAGAPAVPAVPALPVLPKPVRVEPGVLEEPVFLEETRTVFGIVSRPDGGAAPQRAIVLVNSGALHHTGPNRLWVRLARRWAARGALVLRVDLAGIGDSAPWPGDAENVVYPAEHDRSLKAVMHFLREAGLTTVHGAGVCSGAYHLVKAAGAGHPFTRVVAINPLVFYWKDGMSLDYPRHLVAETAAQHKRSMLHWDKWRKLLTGGVDLVALANVWARHATGSATSWMRNFARVIGRPLVEDIGADIGAIVRRGVTLHFVFSEGEPGEVLLRSGGGWVLERLARTGAVRIDHLPGSDHTFTPMWTQDVLSALLETDFDLA